VVDRLARHATACNHTATHLLHAALRERLGHHVRQAGSAVRPDKLRFDFTHGKALSPDELSAIEERVNQWITESRPVRAIHTTRQRAEELGAMALFGEKYGDEVRMVEVDGVSRELCGGTHVQTTAEVGAFKVVSEGSSAANVRRIEVVTGPEALKLLRERDRVLTEVAGRLRVPPEGAATAVESLASEKAKLERLRKDAGSEQVDRLLTELVEKAQEVDGLKVVTETCDDLDREAILALSDRVKTNLKDAAVVLGTTAGGRPHLVANFTPSAVKRGLSAAEVIRKAAEVVGGGGGGRDTMAQAGGKDPDRLEEALEVARKAIESKLS
jgi:alanyl-tRNA synthetase